MTYLLLLTRRVAKGQELYVRSSVRKIVHDEAADDFCGNSSFDEISIEESKLLGSTAMDINSSGEGGGDEDVKITSAENAIVVESVPEIECSISTVKVSQVTSSIDKPGAMKAAHFLDVWRLIGRGS